MTEFETPKFDESLDHEGPMTDRAEGWGIGLDPDGEPVQGPDPAEPPEDEDPADDD